MQITHFQLLRNIGQFASAESNSRPELALKKLALIYGENGRGKTTLSAILRSAASGDAKWLSERHRLRSTQPPHIVLNTDTRPFVFQNGQWAARSPHIAIFDDTFIGANVCSGIEIESEHRRSLHELILGARGVTLNATLQQHTNRIEQHNQELRRLAAAVPTAALGERSLEAFCSLPSGTFAVETVDFSCGPRSFALGAHQTHS